jgi:hypothetical protein
MLRKMRLVRVVLACVLVCGVVGVVGVGVAGAEGPQGAWWHVSSSARPSVLRAGGSGVVTLEAYNVGDAAVSGLSSPVVITDRLPAGFTASSVEGWSGYNFIKEDHDGGVNCHLVVEGSEPVREVSCQWEEEKPLQPFEVIEVAVGVEVAAGAVSASNETTVSGGLVNVCEQVAGGGGFKTPACDGRPEGSGASEAGDGEYAAREAGAVPQATVQSSLAVGAGETPFGVSEYALSAETDEGTVDSQAGSHPFQLTTALSLNEGVEAITPPALPKNIHVVLPAGLIGNATVMPKCTGAEFATFTGENANLCPADTAVGVASVAATFYIGTKATPEVGIFPVPVFNLEPREGEPARFGFELEQIPVTVDTRVRTGSDYAVEAVVSDTTTSGVLQSSVLSLWGAPGDQRHDSVRGWQCIAAHHYDEGPLCGSTEGRAPAAFLSLPTSCVGEPQTSVLAESWPAVAGGTGVTSGSPLIQRPLPVLDGCDRIPFTPSLSVAPDRTEPGSPEGYSVDVHVPQEASGSAEGVTESAVRSTVVTLPEGVSVNPSSAGGLEACSEGQVGYLGSSNANGEMQFSAGEAACPVGSKIATARLKIPVLANPLEGGLYLAAQDANPFGSLIAVYLIAKDPASGVLVKLAGDVSLNQATGRITTSFVDTPQAPVEDIELHTLGGERSALSTPSHCGTATTTGLFTPWSGNAAVEADSSFVVTGASCPAVLPFAPRMVAGTSEPVAGGFAPVSTVISREDGEQAFGSVQVKMPQGLSGVLTGVALCGETEANTGSCTTASKIGESSVNVGVGSQPYTINGGQVYLTGPYDGAPFGLSIVTQAIAGPFNLGPVVVRARLEVNPVTAQITVTTNASGTPGGIPRIIQGIPAQIKRLSVSINRKGFTFNPTNCTPASITGSATGLEGATSALSSRFQATSCASLRFAPKLTASVSGHGSKRDGVSFTTKLTYPTGSLGKQANVKAVKVDLPLQLPTQDSTLKKACLAAVFDANPANCPKDSIVGHATVTTPQLPVPLTGPAYFVSHGGEAFPSLTMVLKGYGITIELVGSTYIHKGVTSTTFKTTPDVPFNTFELTLGQGPYAALTAYLPHKHGYNLCGLHLKMPTALLAQNGTETHTTTNITTTGCTTPKHTKH